MSFGIGAYNLELLTKERSSDFELSRKLIESSRSAYQSHSNLGVQKENNLKDNLKSISQLLFYLREVSKLSIEAFVRTQKEASAFLSLYWFQSDH